MVPRPAQAPACMHAAAALTSHRSWRAGRCGPCAQGASRWTRWSPHASWQHSQQSALDTEHSIWQKQEALNPDSDGCVHGSAS